MKNLPELYEGPACRHGHVTANNTTWRLCSSGACVKCNREKARRSHNRVGRLNRWASSPPPQRRAIVVGMIPLGL